MITMLILVILAAIISPWPSAYIIGRMFDGPVKMTDKPTYKIANKQVNVQKDLRYYSAKKKNTLDIYTPKNGKKPMTTLIWMHGGGYVGGDKIGVKEFATKLVHDTHIAVVSVNYQTAPAAIYPSQVYQLNDAVRYLKRQSYANNTLNFSRVLFGGDSAGAQIALQYVNVQTNPNYARDMSLPAELSTSNIKGAISYCGPLDLQQVTQQKTKSLAMKWFINTVAWSELGHRNWQNSAELKQASLVGHLTNKFPPTYVTDGNAYSFQEQGIAFKNRLQNLKVPVTSLFFKDSRQEVTHEYQFNYQTAQAKICYEGTRQFILKNK
nr:alpha/beta hydrolase [Leuconostoc rapi]